MKQRLGIATALLNRPQLLILDEPTNGLDPAGIHEIRELIKEMPAKFGMTVLVSSHLLSEIELMATQVGIIQNGKMLFQDSIEVLRKESEPKIKIKVDKPLEAASSLNHKGIEANFEEEEGTVYIQESSPSIAGEVNKILVEAGFTVSRLEGMKKSLEDIFLDLYRERTELIMGPIFSSDLVKIKRSWFWGLVLFFPAVLVGGVTLLLLLNAGDIQQGVSEGRSYNIWGTIWMITFYGNYFIIHLSVTILCSYIANLEHQARSWKLIFSMPISKTQYYWTRYMWICFGVLFSGLFLMGAMCLSGFLFGGSATFNASRIFYFTMFPYLTSFALIGLQLWMSMVLNNQAIPMMMGGVGIALGLFLIQLPGVTQYLPWVLPYQVTFSNENIITDFSSIVNSLITSGNGFGLALAWAYFSLSLDRYIFPIEVD